jgi:DNA-binding IclR family transcriptional regulator
MDIQGIQSLEIGIELFRHLHQFGRPVTLSELASRASMAPAKAHRYLVSLVRTGLVAQEGRGLYGLGPLVAVLAGSGTGLQYALEVAGAGLQALADEVQETVFVAAWGQHGARVMRVAEPPREILLRPSTPGDLPLWNSASSRAIAAFMPTDEVERLLNMELEGEHVGGVSMREVALRRRRFNEQMAEVRRTFVAHTAGERHAGVVSFSAPVFDGQSRPLLGVTVFGIAATLDALPCGKVPQRILQYARQVTAKLGGKFPSPTPTHAT